MDTKPKFTHNCTKCEFLGHTIGGGHLYDLYLHLSDSPMGSSVIARFSDEGADYYSCPIQYAHPQGHAELWAAASIAREKYPITSKLKRSWE